MFIWTLCGNCYIGYRLLVICIEYM
uniref:Uncharacterized protein n=1 Tax=Arundo donax TaxID=35708 RepID=A0A0A8YVH4_ARUDO